MSRLLSYRILPYDLPLATPWVTAQGATRGRAGWLLALSSDDGLTGWGDCPASVPGHGHLDGSLAGLDSLARAQIGRSPADALASVEKVAGSPAAALDCALHDLIARERGLPLAASLAEGAAGRVAVNSVSPLGKLGEVPAFSVIKVKVGIRPWAEEAAALRRAKLPLGVSLRLDANRAWSLQDARAMLDALDGLAVESLEEPLAKPNLKDLATLQAGTPIDLAVDESLADFRFDALLAARPVRRLVVKLGALGGLGPTLAAIERARAAGMRAVVTSRVESAVGVAGALHLAAALAPGEGSALAHGLATSDWLRADICRPVPVVDGMMAVPARPGLGLDLEL